jgi:hypothetical protein
LLTRSSMPLLFGCPFPISFVPLLTLLAAKKPILFDSPPVSSYEDALCTIRAIAQSETIVRSRLTDRLSPDSPKSLLARSCASLHRHSCRRLIGRSAFQQQPFASISTGDSLSRCSARTFCRPSRPFSLSRHKFLSGPHVWRTRGSAIVEFEVPNSCLRRIRVDGLAVAPARQACLSLRGQSGLLTLHAATKGHPDSTACTIIDFLTAIRFCPQSPSNAAQRTFLSVGVLQLIHDSGTKIRGAILNHQTDQSRLKADC